MSLRCTMYHEAKLETDWYVWQSGMKSMEVAEEGQKQADCSRNYMHIGVCVLRP